MRHKYRASFLAWFGCITDGATSTVSCQDTNHTEGRNKLFSITHTCWDTSKPWWDLTHFDFMTLNEAFVLVAWSIKYTRRFFQTNNLSTVFVPEAWLYWDLHLYNLTLEKKLRFFQWIVIVLIIDQSFETTRITFANSNDL